MRPATVLVLLAASTAAACAPPDREAQVRAFVDDAIAAAESRRTAFFRQHISEAYADARGRTRDDLIAIVRGYFLINSEVEVVSRIVDIELAGGDFATVVIEAAVIGSRDRPGPLDTDADLGTFEVDLARDGDDWHVVRAAWD